MMNNSTRSLVFAALIALLLVMPVLPVLPALAQDDDPVYCRGLAELDCALLELAVSNFEGVTSFSAPRWLVTLNVVAGDQYGALAADGSAAVVLPAAISALIAELPQLGDRSDLRPLVFFLSQFRTSWVVDVLQQLGAHVVVNHAVVSTSGDSNSGGGELLLRDLNVYLRLPSPTGAQVWFGDNLALTPDELAERDARMREWAETLADERSRAAMAEWAEFEPQFEALSALVERHITSQRRPDAVIRGELMAVFVTQVDVGAMLADPELPGLLTPLMNRPRFGALGQPPRTVNEAQVRFMLMSLGLLLDEATLSVQQWVGMADAQVRRVGLDLDLALSYALWGDQAQVDSVRVNGILVADLASVNATTLGFVPVPQLFYAMDQRERFLVGDQRLIEGTLLPGDTVRGSLESDLDKRDVYALRLIAGETVALELASAGHPWLTVYGPDGFEYGDLDGFSAAPITLTALQDGVYLIAVEALRPLSYTLTVSAG